MIKIDLMYLQMRRNKKSIPYLGNPKDTGRTHTGALTKAAKKAAKAAQDALAAAQAAAKAKAEAELGQKP